jgi:hypothetical protein
MTVEMTADPYRNVRMSVTHSLVWPLLVALSLCSACARSEVHDAPLGKTQGGAIEGRILHPAHVIPPMRICAIGSGAPNEARRICIETRRDQSRYRIEGLPADDYIVIAETDGRIPMYRVGGHMQPVQCIRAPCPEMPKTVTVGENAVVDGIDLNVFYDTREDFPSLRNGT